MQEKVRRYEEIQWGGGGELCLKSHVDGWPMPLFVIIFNLCLYL